MPHQVVSLGLGCTHQHSPPAGSGTTTCGSLHDAPATARPLTVRILPLLANAARFCAAKIRVIDRCHPPLEPLELEFGVAVEEPFSGIHQPANLHYCRWP